MNSINYVKVASGEAEVIAAFAREIWPAVYSDMISQEQINYMLDWMYDPSKIREEIEAEDITYLFIREKSENIGFLAFGPVNPGETCFIHKVYLSPTHHRRGIGIAALHEIEKRNAFAGVKCLELRVNRENKRAIGLYQKAGFQIVAKDCADIGNGFVMDDYIFRKLLA